MPLISIITAVYKGRERYIMETARSLLGQELPPGIDMEWLVQEDGDVPVLGEVVREIGGSDRVRYEANQRKLGPGGTRSLALVRARGAFVRNLDSDDVLLPRALTTEYQVFVEHPSLQWSVAQPSRLIDGTTKPYETPLPPGLIRRGAIHQAIVEQGHIPIHAAGLMARIDAVRALGGWLGLPSGEDFALVAALSEMFDGWHNPAVTWLYRHHSNQMTNDPNEDERSRFLGVTSSAQRVEALRRLGLGRQE